MQKIGKKIKDLIIKILLITVAISFVIWGINGGRSTKKSDWVIRVENQELSYSDWQKSLHSEMERMKKYHREFNKKGKEYDEYDSLFHIIKLKVLKQSINEMILLEEAKRLGISASDEQIKKELQKIDIFLDKKGRFSKKIFHKIMQNNGLSESAFIEKLKDHIMRSQMMEIFIPHKQPMAPQIKDALIRSKHIEKVVDLYKISATNTNINFKLHTPKDEVLQDFINKNKMLFIQPEVRNYSYFILTINELEKNNIIVSDHEIEDMYQDKKSLYIEKEKRDIEQIVLKTEAEALDLRKKLITHKVDQYFTELAKKFSITPENIILKNIEIKNFSTKRVRDIISRLKENEISVPIRTTEGWNIFMMKKIYPERIKLISEVKDELKTQIYNEKLFELLNKSAKDIEQDLNINNSYENYVATAKKYKLQIKKVKNAYLKINQDSKDLSNTTLQINKIAFEIKNIGTSLIAPISEGEAFVGLYMENIQTTHLPEFNLIKNKSVEIWNRTQCDIILSNIAQKKLLSLQQDNRIKKETNYEKETNRAYIIEDPNIDIDINKIKLLPTQIIISNDKRYDIDIPYLLYEEFLDTTSGSISTIHRCNTKQDGCYIFGQVKQIKYLNNDEINKLEEKFKTDIDILYNEMMIEEYLRALRKRYKIQLRNDVINLKIDT